MDLNARCIGCKFLCKMLAVEDASKCSKYEELVKKDKGEVQKTPVRNQRQVYIKRRG